MEESAKSHKKSIRFFNDREVRAVWMTRTTAGVFRRLTLSVQSTMSRIFREIIVTKF